MQKTNRKAFLDVIAFSEGTKGKGNDGYNVIVGGELFYDYSSHPNKRVYIKRINNYSTAAGRYQLLNRYWIAYKKLLGLSDFSPSSQDAIAIQQIRECRALSDIDSGDFNSAVDKCCHIWASFPGANYRQRENNIDILREKFIEFGGTML